MFVEDMPAHSCWGLNEIVCIIAATLVSENAAASAVALARCSRSLQEPVLCEVWRSLSSLAPLIKCFPHEVWGFKLGQLVFNRAPFRMEWTRFQQQYASKVRHLVVSPADGVHSNSLQILQLYSHGSPLLPHLLSLEWNSDDADLHFISSFTSQSLTSISIDVPSRASRMLPPILTGLPTMSPDISAIEVQRMRYEPSMEEASSHLLMQCKPRRLRKYNVDAPLSASALRHVIQLPVLEAFWLVDPFQFPHPLPDVVFPSLQQLDVEVKDIAWLDLLPAIQSRVLSMISVEYPGTDLARFMEAFQLITTGCGMHERLKAFVMRGRFRITPQIIDYTSSFKNLTSLKFLSSCSTACRTIDLTDDTIDLLATAMPGLKSLAVGERPCSAPSKITFKGLYTISRRCTQLTTLQIHFRPNSFVTKVNDSDIGLSVDAPSSDLCSITKINVGSIPLPRHWAKTIRFRLLEVFPRLEKIEYGDSAAWKEVDNLIAVHRRGLSRDAIQ